MNDHFPSIGDLKPKQGKRIARQTILSVDIVGEPWRDDHEFCCDLRITTALGLVECSLWWITWEFLAAATYANVLPAAMKAVSEEIASRINEENHQ